MRACNTEKDGEFSLSKLLNESMSRCEACSVSATPTPSFYCRTAKTRVLGVKDTNPDHLRARSGNGKKGNQKTMWGENLLRSPLALAFCRGGVRIFSRLWEARRESGGRRKARLVGTARDKISEGAADLLGSLSPAHGGMVSAIDCNGAKQFSQLGEARHLADEEPPETASASANAVFLNLFGAPAHFH